MFSLGALTNATLGHETNKERVGECGGIFELFTTLRNHSEEEKIVVNIFSSLRNISALDANKIRVREIGGIPIIFETLKRHSTSSAIAQVAFATIYNLSINEENAQLFVKLGAIPIIAKASNSHGGSIGSLGDSLVEILKDFE
jgi:hypothetical protein